MLPKTRFRKRIELEKEQMVERFIKEKLDTNKSTCQTNVDLTIPFLNPLMPEEKNSEDNKIKVFINNKEPELYFKGFRCGGLLAAEVNEEGKIEISYFVKVKPNNIMEIGTTDFVYNSVRNRLDLYV